MDRFWSDTIVNAVMAGIGFHCILTSECMHDVVLVAHFDPIITVCSYDVFDMFYCICTNMFVR